MKGVTILQSVICIILLQSALYSGTADAQRPRRGGNQISVTGWADDTHFFFRSPDKDNKLVTRSIDVKTGKGIGLHP